MPEIPSRLVAALADRYRIERELGAGGMATVYLAEDLKHDRKVALKVLKPELAAVLGAERFVVEIKTTAALSHPHILPLFDSGEADGFLFYVMPFIDGETLRDRLNRETQLGVDEAIRITREIADALHYAHSRGVIHRDIKPENILLQGGRPMVADFGIALAVSAAAGGRMTETGLSLGTPHYMSPEQATADKSITARSDVYSLASVCYEMLAGEPPHTGGSAQQIIMKIIAERAQPVTELRSAVPEHVAAALEKALAKLPADRFDSAQAFAEALGNTSFTVATRTAAGMRSAAPWQLNRLATSLAAALVLVGGVAAWLLTRPAPSQPVSRYSIRLPDDGRITGLWLRLALSPDGSRIVYTGGVPPQVNLWVRERNALESRALAGTENPVAPFFSPDGSRIGFERSSGLHLMTLSGGPPMVLDDARVGAAGATWSPDGFIYADGLGPVSLVRVSVAEGGKTEWFTQLDSARGERDHIAPSALPNGKGVLFTVIQGEGGVASRVIAVASTATGAHKVLVRGVYARYAETGHLLYVTADRALMAVAFDQDEMTVSGEPVVLARDVELRGNLAVPDLAISSDGTLVYTTGAGATDGGAPVWVDRDGKASPIAEGWAPRASHVSVSPDGSQLAIAIQDAGVTNLWVRRLNQSGNASKLTFEGGLDIRPSWSPDGRRILFISQTDGIRSAFARRADGTGNSEPILRFPPSMGEEQAVQEALLTNDGAWLVYRAGGGTAANLYARRTVGDTTPVILANSIHPENSVTVSPDGRWVAYASSETGRYDVYVRPFPDVSTGKWLISVDGGTEPLWAPNGRELFYRNGKGEMVAVAVSPGGGAPPTGLQRVLFDATAYATDQQQRAYGVSQDGKRFVMLAQDNVAGNTPLELIVVENFFEELKRLVPRR